MRRHGKGGTEDQPEVDDNLRLNDPERWLEALYANYARLVFRVAFYTSGGNLDIAEDVVPETFSKAWLQRDQYDPMRSKVQTWLGGIARNATHDILRFKGRRPTVSWEELREGETGDTSEYCDPSDVLMALESRLDINQWLAETARRLNPREQQVLQASFIEGTPNDEVADLLGVSSSAVMTSRWRIRTAVRGEPPPGEDQKND